MKIIPIIILMLLSPCAFAQFSVGSGIEKLTIYASYMLYFGSENRSTFTGDVVVVSDTFTLTADRAEVYFNDNDTIKIINCFDNVNIKTDEILAISDLGDVQVDDNMLTITGNVKIWQSGNYIEGERVTIDYVTKEMRAVKGDLPRVRVIINTQND